MKINKIKQSEYKVVSNPLYGYRFSLSSCNAAAIGAYIISLIIAISLSMLVLLYENDECDWNGLRECSGYIFVFSLPFFLIGVWQMSWARQIKKIITKGKQVDGKIIKYHKTASNNRTTIYVMFNYHFEQVCIISSFARISENSGLRW